MSYLPSSMDVQAFGLHHDLPPRNLKASNPSRVRDGWEKSIVHELWGKGQAERESRNAEGEKKTPQEESSAVDR